MGHSTDRDRFQRERLETAFAVILTVVTAFKPASGELYKKHPVCTKIRLFEIQNRIFLLRLFPHWDTPSPHPTVLGTFGQSCSLGLNVSVSVSSWTQNLKVSVSSRSRTPRSRLHPCLRSLDPHTYGVLTRCRLVASPSSPHLLTPEPPLFSSHASF